MARLPSACLSTSSTLARGVRYIAHTVSAKTTPLTRFHGAEGIVEAAYCWITVVPYWRLRVGMGTRAMRGISIGFSQRAGQGRAPGEVLVQH
ncbi:hypothetical protein FB451DRAFT_1410557 [Mycena latifolia]|nr:hypothetical protein FB451DRAFT_1410557 [Mycena latifolia]